MSDGSFDPWRLALDTLENLCRAELTPAQRAAAIARRKQIWEALHPEGGKTVSTLGGVQQVAFAADTAKAAGMTKQSINQHLSRAEVLGADLQAVAGKKRPARPRLLPPSPPPKALPSEHENNPCSAFDLVL